MTIVLETKRLILKPTSLSDFDNLLALRSDPEVMKYIGDGSIRTKEEVQDFIECGIAYYKQYGLDFFCVFEKETNAFIGQAGLFHLGFDVKQTDIELAYRLHKKYWHQGYATELATALIDWGFNQLSLAKIIAIAHPENKRSIRVMEKVGMTYRGGMNLHGKQLVYYETYKNDSIELIPYDERWPHMAELEMKKLRKILPENTIIDIQHVGSTAIPGMLAKPILDIQIAVDSLEAIKPSAINALTRIGYEFWYENPDPERLFFVKGMPPLGEKRTHHVHIVEPLSPHWQNKILFRDYLRLHPETAKAYGD